MKDGQMTEGSYILLTNAERIGTAAEILRNVLTGFDDVIDEKEYRRICAVLWDWREDLRKKLEIVGEYAKEKDNSQTG